MFTRIVALAALALSGIFIPSVSAQDAAVAIKPGQDLWAKEIGATVCPRPDQIYEERRCSILRDLDHIRILSRGVLAEDPLSYQSLSQRSYFLIAKDDGTQWFTGLGEIGRFYTEDPRGMAEKEASQSAGNDSNPYVGREFWRTDNYSAIAICPTPRSAMHHDPEICRAVKPGTHLKIVKAGTLEKPYGDGSMFDQYYMVRSDDNTYGYVKLTDVGSPELDWGMPASEAPSFHGIAWEDPKITAAKLKTVEAAAKAVAETVAGFRG